MTRQFSTRCVTDSLLEVFFFPSVYSSSLGWHDGFHLVLKTPSLRADIFQQRIELPSITSSPRQSTIFSDLRYMESSWCFPSQFLVAIGLLSPSKLITNLPTVTWHTRHAMNKGAYRRIFSMAGEIKERHHSMYMYLEHTTSCST